MNSDPWVWLGALLTLMVFSFLYKDNPFYKFAEHLFVGVANGYYIVFYWHQALKPNLFDPLSKGEFLYLIPLFLGLLYFTKFIPKISYLVRIPIGFMIGWGAGVSIPANFQGFIFRQLEGTVIRPEGFANILEGLWAVLILIGVISTVLYFFFSREHKGVLNFFSKTGIIFIMIGFGASFGYTVMARVSLLIGRIQFLFGTWLGLIM